MTETAGIQMLTINEAAKKVPGLAKYRIREMCIKGELPYVKAGRKYLICNQVLMKKLTEPETVTFVALESGELRKINK